MSKKVITTKTADPLGAHDEIAKHREQAALVFKNPECLGVQSSSEPDPKRGGIYVYSITTTWQEGPAPEPEAKA